MNRLSFIHLVCAAALCLAAIGVGSAIHLPAAAAQEYQQIMAPIVAAATCAKTTACFQETNTSTGAGVEGISKKGNGTIGQTSVTSTSANNAKAGVLGQDLSASGVYDSGVLGTSTQGIGVQGSSTNGFGVEAVSKNGVALRALSTNGVPIFAQNSGAGEGILSIALSNDGTISTTQNNSSIGPGASGVLGQDTSTDGGSGNVGVTGLSINGTGVIGKSTNGTGVYGASTGSNGSGVFGQSANWIGVGTVGGYYNINTHYSAPAISVDVNYTGQTADVLDACVEVNPCDNSNWNIARMDGNGNLNIIGKLFTSGSCSTGCVNRPGVPGRRVLSYAPSEAQPTMEDVGEAQLVGGRAYVRLEARYATVIDRNGRYFVFVTPEGNTNGVYVTQVTGTGFEVRENNGGQSTVAFQYRIVAKPYGESGARLPVIDMRGTSAPAKRHI
jgi:hypothetical protein